MVIKILHRFLFQFFCNLRCDGGKYLNVEGNVSFTDLPTNSLPSFFFSIAVAFSGFDRFVIGELFEDAADWILPIIPRDGLFESK